jgi:signal transduction histidine kinase
MRELGKLVTVRWPGLAGAGGVAATLWLLGFRLQLDAGQRRRERRVDEELVAYARLNVQLPGDKDGRELAGQLSRLVAEKSAFHRVAMLIADAGGRLSVASSRGIDDATAQLLNVWGEGLAGASGTRGIGIRRGNGGLGVRVGGRSFAVVLGEGPAEIGYQRAIVIPLWTTGGRLLGALTVGADGWMSVRRSVLEKALEPLEALAFKVERVMENTAMAERLLRAEKLSGLGLLAGGTAHALNNPLTAVLGFAELIADTTKEGRVKEDAEVIVREALRMRQTVETLLEFWQPATEGVEPVDVVLLIRELAGACAGKLAGRGVRLVVEAGDEGTVVRGNRVRLRQMMEHLLNNAAQALAAAKKDEEPMIRVSVSAAGERVYLLVSDTGPGFAEPGRVFEPCGSMGLGLSVCYGIVHEHGGEISAFNLHPHGAAVAVEFPLADFAGKKSEMAATEKIYSASV